MPSFSYEEGRETFPGVREFHGVTYRMVPHLEVCPCKCPPWDDGSPCGCCGYWTTRREILSMTIETYAHPSDARWAATKDCV